MSDTDMDMARYFLYSMAYDETKDKTTWDDWQELWIIENEHDRVAFLEWVGKHGEALLVASTYGVKSVLLDIALNLLMEAYEPEPEGIPAEDLLTTVIEPGDTVQLTSMTFTPEEEIDEQ